MRVCSRVVSSSPLSSVASDRSSQVKSQAAIRALVRPHWRVSTRDSYSLMVCQLLPGSNSR